MAVVSLLLHKKLNERAKKRDYLTRQLHFRYLLIIKIFLYVNNILWLFINDNDKPTETVKDYYCHKGNKDVRLTA